ncbi:reverse transcriptase [Trichonephila clavata]|uniref:Reverse transcriptase n=1 Tax=Trichonephila clavata TaxID=2740835 RepID=A0A8X6FHV3_TRICU|nr:reverse transcriptase [Trichonephila clavata]
MKAAKKEFEFILQQGLCRPSKSTWAGPSYLVLKKSGDLMPCGDYRALNNVTIPDRYPIPYLTDCTHILHDAIFSSIDLIGAYQKIPVHEADIPKTAITPFGFFEFPFMTYGFKANSTTAYHPQANGLIEQQHCSIKKALRCYLSSLTWTENVPLILLGLHSAIKQDLGCSSAELVYGSLLKLPGELFFSTSNEIKHSEFLRHLQKVICELRPILTTTHGRKTVFVASKLSSCSHVFIFKNAATSSLQPTYLGPYATKRRKEKYFDVDVDGLIKRISIDHLKEAFFVKNEAESLKSTVDPESKNVQVTKSGIDMLNSLTISRITFSIAMAREVVYRAVIPRGL